MGQNLEHCREKMRQNPGPYHNVCTIDFTSDGMPMGVASGNLWLVRLATVYGAIDLTPLDMKRANVRSNNLKSDKQGLTRP